MQWGNFERVFLAFTSRRRFQPFALELRTGCRIEVHHPEAITFQDELIVFLSDTGVRSVFESDEVVRFITATGT